MNLYEIIYYIPIVITLMAGFVVVFAANDIHAVIALFISSVGLACHFVFHNAEYCALSMIVIFAGIALTLVLFTVTIKPESVSRNWQNGIRRLLPLMAVLIILYLLISYYAELFIEISGRSPGNLSLEELSSMLLGEYLFPLEIAAVILFSSIIGAASIIRRNN